MVAGAINNSKQIVKGATRAYGAAFSSVMNSINKFFE